MTLTPDQLHDLLNMMRVQLLIFAGNTNGTQSLSTEELNLLTSHGIDVGELYKVTDDPILLNFHLGLLSQAIGHNASKNITYEQLKKYIQSNKHIPLTQRELATIESVKRQSLADIRAHQGKIFQDINGVINHHQTTERAGHEDFIRENIAQGLIDNKTARQIAVDLARLTGDWSRNFYKSVSYICHTALNEGRLAMIQRREGNSGKVYFQVQPQACERCIKLYLTNGEGSEPRIFSINTLLENGNNIGRKADQWRPVVSQTHINCRCLLTEYIEGEQWIEGRFTVPKEPIYHPRIDRKKVRIIFDGKEYFV